MYAILIFLTLLSFTQSNPIAGNCISGKCQVSDQYIPPIPKVIPLKNGPVKRMGNYKILCGAKNEKMASVLKGSRIALGRAIQDLGSGSPSHGYEQLFGSTSPTDVKAILQKILAGSPATLVPVASPTLSGSTMRISPTIACMDDQTAPLYNHPLYLKNVCRSVSHQAVPFAVYVQPTPYILICEPFWHQPTLPPIPTPKTKHLICPAWNPYMQQIDPRGAWERDTLGYQVFSLIHQGVHFYEHESFGMLTTPMEVYEWEDMTRLSSVEKRKNPMNYNAYVAMVYSDCQLDKSAELLPEHLNRSPKSQEPPQRSTSMRFKDHWN